MSFNSSTWRKGGQTVGHTTFCTHYRDTRDMGGHWIKHWVNVQEILSSPSLSPSILLTQGRVTGHFLHVSSIAPCMVASCSCMRLNKYFLLSPPPSRPAPPWPHSQKNSTLEVGALFYLSLLFSSFLVLSFCCLPPPPPLHS